MSKVQEVVDLDELKSIIDNNDRVVIDFQALAWCRPCQQLQPHFDTASDQSSAEFVAVDVDKAVWAMEEYGVRGVPTVMLFENGEYVKNIVGRNVVQILSELE